MKNLIELPITELKTALMGLGKVIGKSTLPVLQCIRIMRDSDGIITFQAADPDNFVLYQAKEPQIGPLCDFLVPYEPLNKAVKGNLTSLQICPVDSTKVHLTSFIGSTPIGKAVETVKVDEFPKLPLFETAGVPVDEVFRDALRQALDCCSQDESRLVLQHVCVDVTDKKSHYIVATNGQHLYSANSFSFDLKDSVLLPDQRFLRWKEFMSDGKGELNLKLHTKEEPSWAQLKSGNWTFCTRQIELPYPNWKTAIPQEERISNTTICLKPEGMETLLATIPQLPCHDDYLKPVQLVAEPGRLIVQGRDRDAKDWTNVVIQGVVVKGKPITIAVNRDYLSKALRYGFNTIELQDELTALDLHNGGKRMIIMPQRTAATQVPEATPEPVTPATQPTPPPPAIKEEAKKETKPMTTAAPETNPESPIKTVLLKIDQIKDSLKGVLRDLTETTDLLKQVEKDKKATDKEIESVREKLREIQSVKI